MSYNKPTKYKILDMKNNQQLIDDEMVIQKLPFRTENPRPPKWFQKFEKQNNERWDKQDKVNQMVFGFMEKQTKWFQEFEKRNNERFDRIELRLDKLEIEVKAINVRIDNLVKVNNLKE